jgi:hypothetical protein
LYQTENDANITIMVTNQPSEADIG